MQYVSTHPMPSDHIPQIALKLNAQTLILRLTAFVNLLYLALWEILL